MITDVELLISAKDNVAKVYEKMTEMESLTELKRQVVAGELNVKTVDGAVITLGLLSKEQTDKVICEIVSLIDNNMTDARKFLNRFNLLTNKPAMINQDFEDAVNEMVAGDKELSQESSQNVSKDVKSDEITSETGKGEELHLSEESSLKIENTASSEDVPPEMNEANLRKYYIDEDKTVKELTELFATNTTTLYKELGRYGLVDQKKTQRKDKKLQTPSNRKIK